MSIKKGDVVQVQFGGEGSYQFRISAATKVGFRGTWIDGPLAGKSAHVERSIVVHRGRLPVQVGG